MVKSSQYFNCKSGLVLTSLHDLLHEFKHYSKGIDIEDFEFHFKNNGNDYANWLRDVFLEGELAKKIRDEKDPKKVYLILKEFLGASNEPKKEEQKKEVKKEGFEPLELESFTDKSDAMQERVKNLKLKTRAPVAKEQDVSKLKDIYDLLYTEISEYRKQGKDVFIPALYLRNIKSKIAYFQASGETTDYNTVIHAFEEVKKELKEALQIKEPNLKKEIMKEVENSKEGENGV